MTMLRLAARTHVGAVRTENQDCVLVDGWLSARDSAWTGSTTLTTGDPAYVVAVCDGMGGHSGGSVASRVAAAGLAERAWADATPDLVTERVRSAAVAVQTVSDGIAALRGLGSTVAGIAFTYDRFSVFNVGDSSVFRHAPGSLGELTTPDRRPDPHRLDGTVLTASLSMFTAVPAPHVEVFPVLSRTRLVVCTDGLTDAIPLERLRCLLDSHDATREPEQVVAALVSAALDAGAPDNVSVVVVDLTPAPNDEEAAP